MYMKVIQLQIQWLKLIQIWFDYSLLYAYNIAQPQNPYFIVS